MAQKFTITAELNLKAKNIGQVVKQLQTQFQGANVNFNIKQMTAAQTQLKKVGASAQVASKSVNGLARNIAEAAKKFSALTLATGTFVGLARSIKNATGDAIEFQREIVKIAQTTGQSTSSLKGLADEVTRVATTFGVSSKELLNASRTLTQAGFAANKVKGALDILAKTELAATFDSIADTTEGVIALLNQFGRSAQKSGTEIQFLERSLSAINQVSKEFAVESSDLITAIRTTGSAFESAGGSLDELLGLFTSVRATTRESAESIATGFRTIFTRVQRVDTINNLKKLGIELQDATGKFVGPVEATKRLSAALATIDPRDFRFNVIVEELGGFRQVSKVIPLIQQFSVAQKALNSAQRSSGSLAQDAQVAQEALSVQIAKTREEFLALIRSFAETSTFKSVVQGALDLSSAFIKVAETLKPLLPMIGIVGAAKLGINFLPSINSSLMKRKASGGQIYKFASGGFVPGTGNGDTVPAMLTPGEFVIRKSSVKKLGAENLARVNKYADGGAVQYYKKAGEVRANDITKRRVRGKNDNQYFEEVVPDRRKKGSEEKKEFTRLLASNNLAFTHLDKLKKGIFKGKEENLYSNVGLDLPSNWNSDWNQEQNNKGIYTGDLKSYISQHKTGSNSIFSTLLKEQKLVLQNMMDDQKNLVRNPITNKVKQKVAFSSGEGGPYGFIGGKKSIAYRELKDKADDIATKLSAKIPNSFVKENRLDTDYDVINRGISQKLFDAIEGSGAENVLQEIKMVVARNVPKKDSLLSKRGTKNIDPETGRDKIKKVRKRFSQKRLLNNQEIFDDSLYENTVEQAEDIKNQYVPKRKAKPIAANLGGLIQKFQDGGRAEAFRGARAITIPQPESYTYNKPAGIDLDSLTGDSKNYKVNAGDRLQYNRINHNIDLDKENVSSGLFSEYKAETDPAKRGKIFEKILLSLGKVQSLSKMQNARLDAISASGNPSEIKSRQEAMNIKELEEKLWGAIVSNADGSLAEMMTRDRMNSNKWTDGEDLFNIGSIDVFEDITGGLGKEINAKEVRTRQEVQAVKTAKEMTKAATNEARAKLQVAVAAVVGKDSSLYNIKGTVLPPLSGKGELYSDTVTAVRKALNIDNVADLWPAIAQMQPSEIQKAVRNSIQRKAAGGFIEKFANGGFSSGTDTVPAMLTPGEFVVNKKSAQKIGYGQLNRMNKMGKYANGGVVQEFLFGGGVKSAADAETRIQGFNISGKAKIGLTKLFKEIENDGGNVSKAFKTLEKSITNAKNGFKYTKDFKNSLTEVSKTSNDYSNKLLLLSTITGSVGTQFTGLSEEFQSAATSFITSFGAIKTTVDLVGGQLQEFGFDKFGKAVKGASIAVALLQSASSAYNAYIDASIKKSNETINKQLGLAAEGKGNRAEYDKAVQDLASGLENKGNLAARGSSTSGLVGGTIGGIIGSAIAPGVGTAVGAAIGVGIGAKFDQYLYPSVEGLGKTFISLNKDLYDSQIALIGFNKKAEKFAELSFKDVEKTTTNAATEFAKLQANLDSATAALAKAPESQKSEIQSTIDKTNEQIKNFNAIIAKGTADLQNKILKEISTKASVGLVSPAQIDQYAKQLTEPLRKARQGELNSKDQKVREQAQKELTIAELENKQSISRATAQIYKQEAALKREQEARNALIGSIYQEKAIREAAARFESDLQQLSDAVKAAQGVFQDSLSLEGFSNLDSVIKSFSINAPTKEFQQGLNILGNALGDEGVKMGNSLKDLQVASGSLDVALIELNRGLSSGVNYEQFFTDYFKRLGVGANSPVVKQIAEITRKTIGGEDKEKGVVPGSATNEVREQISQLFDKFRQSAQEQAELVVKLFSDYEKGITPLLESYAQGLKKVSEYQLESIDRLKNFNDVMARATGRTITLAEKEGFRQSRQNALGGYDVRKLGEQLNKLTGQQLQLRQAREFGGVSGRQDIEKYGRSVLNLKLQTDQTVQALKSLADQSGKTGDILSEIERIRGQRDTVREFGKSYAFGTDEQRKEIVKSIDALQTAFAYGDLDAIPEDMRSAVSQLLDRFKDVPIFGGMTGEDISKQFEFKELVKAGVAPQFAKGIFQQSRPEQQLIAELNKVFMQEEAARKILADREFLQQNVLIGSIDRLNSTFDQRLADIGTGKARGEGQATIAREALAQQGIAQAAARSADSFERAAKLLNDASQRIQIQLDRLQVPQNKANGGLIYRAGGGSIFKPKGTDTVPAMLTPGEYVVRKNAVDSIGVDNLDAINYAAGGGLIAAMNRPGRFARMQQTSQQQMLYRNNMISQQMMTRQNLMYGENYGGGNRYQRRADARRAERERVAARLEQLYPERRGTDVRGIDRKFERERREEDSLNQLILEAGRAKQSRYEASISYSNSVRRPDQQRIQDERARQKRLATSPKSVKPSRYVETRPMTMEGVENTTAGSSFLGFGLPSFSDFLAYRSGRAEGAQGTTSEFVRSAGIGLGKSATGLASLAAGAIDLGARQFGVQGNYATRGVTGFEDVAFGSGARSQTGYLAGNLIGNVAQGGAGSTGGLRAFGRQAIRRPGVALDLAQTGLEGASIYSGDNRFRQAGVGLGLLGMAGGARGGLKKPSFRRTKQVTDNIVNNSNASNASKVSKKPKVFTLEEGGGRTFDQLKSTAAIRASGEAEGYIQSTQGASGGIKYNKIIDKNTDLSQLRAQYNPFAREEISGPIIGKTAFFKNKSEDKFYGRAALRRRALEDPRGTNRPIRRYASGGEVDSIPAMLTPGEYVMSSQAVNKHGVGFMNALNRGGVVRGFANGGPVGAIGGAASAAIDGASISEIFSNGISALAGVFNIEALNNVANTFGGFIESMTQLSQTMGGLTMNHQVTVDGQLNLGGFNSQEISDVIVKNIGSFISQEVSRQMNKENFKP